jgi:very-short-patch-repair endonuclease
MKVSLGEGMNTHDGPQLFSLTPLARSMRKSPTPSEAILWRHLCGKQLGVRVRRRHVAFPYVLDFYVASYRLAIEVDGNVHDSAEAQAHDAQREAELARLYGIRVLRINAELVERDAYAAVALVRAAIR